MCNRDVSAFREAPFALEYREEVVLALALVVGLREGLAAVPAVGIALVKGLVQG